MTNERTPSRSRRKLLQVAALSTTAALGACSDTTSPADAGTDVFTVDAGLSTQDAGSDGASISDVIVGVAPQDAGSE
jgi:hypothetical protein